MTTLAHTGKAKTKMELSWDTVKRVLDKHLGDNYEYCGEYGEPRYSCDVQADTDTSQVILADYWCRCGNNPRAGKTEYWASGNNVVAPDSLHDVASHIPRIWQQMERQGVSFEWCDEWTIDYESGKAYRTEADSYSWQPSVIFTEYGDMIVPDSDIADVIDWARNNPRVCIPRTIADGRGLENVGFNRYNTDRYESGWHPGQTDDPTEITESIRREYGDSVDIVFALDATGQFDIAFSAYIREVTDDDD